MTDRSTPAWGTPAAPALAGHSIIPAPGEVEAVDDGWGDAEPTVPPPSAPVTMRLSDPLEFDIPRDGAMPAMILPPVSVLPAPPSAPTDPPPSAPATLRITTRPPASPQTRPSSAPGYGYRASQRPDLASEMKSRFGDGDFSGALLFAEALLAADPAHEEANLYAGSCRVGLAEGYLEELGTRESVPHLLVTAAELIALDLDHGHGFIVAQIDGRATVDEIIDVCGRPEHETLRVLHDLLRRDVLVIK